MEADKGGELGAPTESPTIRHLTMRARREVALRMSGRGVVVGLRIALACALAGRSGGEGVIYSETLGCRTGSKCCTIPPCQCGTYLTCFDQACTSEVCEVCPRGFYCDCTSSCPALGEDGFFLINQCPPGHYCPAYSGRPILCPRDTYRETTSADSAVACLPCSANFVSDPGSAGCHLNPAIAGAIGGGVGGCVLLPALILLGLRLRRNHQGDMLSRFEASKRVRGIDLAALGNADRNEQEDGDDDFEDEEDVEGMVEHGGGGAPRATADEKRRELERRMEVLEGDEDQMFGTLEQQRLERVRAEEIARDEAKKKRKTPVAGPKARGGLAWLAGKRKPKEPEVEEDIEVCV